MKYKFSIQLTLILLLPLLFSYRLLVAEDVELNELSVEQTLDLASRILPQNAANNNYEIYLAPCSNESSKWKKVCKSVRNAFNQSNYRVTDKVSLDDKSKKLIFVHFSKPTLNFQIWPSKVSLNPFNKEGTFFITSEYSGSDNQWRKSFKLQLNSTALNQYKANGKLSCKAKDCLVKAGVNLVIQNLSQNVAQQNTSGFIPVMVHLKSENEWWVRRPKLGISNPSKLQLCYMEDTTCKPIGFAELTHHENDIFIFGPENWHPDSLSNGDWALWPTASKR